MEASSCATDVLVEIDGSEEYEVLELLATTSTDGSQSELAQENQLCGYLAKVNQGGLMKGSKTRWFVFDKDACVLYYHRSPKDKTGNALGSIPISNAGFTCTAEGLLVNSFQITQGSNSHILQAYDQKTMLWWLQELQAERRLYNKRLKRSSARRAVFATPPSTDKAATEACFPGLLQSISPEECPHQEETYGDNLSAIPVLPRVENPPETVGIKSANRDILKPSSGSTLSEIGSKVTQLGGGITKLRPKPQRPAPPSPASVFYAKENSVLTDEHLTLGPVLQSKRAEPKHKSALSRTTSRFTHLLDSIQSAVKTGGKTIPDDSSQLDGITETLKLLLEEMELMKTSLDSKEETIQLLKRELNKYSTLNTFGSVSVMSNENGSPPSSTHQQRSEITTLKLTIEHLRQEVDEAQLLLKQQEEKTKLFQEMLQVKDGIVVQLTNELHEQSFKKSSNNDETRDRSISTPNMPDPSVNEKEKYAEAPVASKKLLDEVEGYRLQNKFLNNEILELTNLRKVDQEKLDSLLEKNLHQEALRCQLQSKYFILLSEMDKARNEATVFYPDSEDPLLHQEGQPAGPSIVQQLIQEAIREGGKRELEIGATFRSSKYDRYGFTQIVDDSDESTFLAAASRLQQTASDIFNSIEQHDALVAAKWQRYPSEKDWQRNAEFKSLVRMGIPHELRHKVWRYLVQVRTHEIRQQLNSDGLYYKNLTETTVAPLHSKQIDLDLLRTLPNNEFFAKIDCAGIQRLKRVLGAYSLHNPEIGYCQGLNRIVAVSLLYLSEEDAFWCLVAIVECIMPQEYYTSTLTASQADQRVFRDLLAEKMPRVHRHLEVMGIDVSLITFNWFLCIFCDGVPPETMFVIWDVLLNESSKVLFRYGLAFFKHVEEDILELNDYMTLFNLLRKMVYRMYDARTLTQIAFQDMNPFRMRKVNRLRALHTEKVHAELHQLDILRSEFASRHAKASTNSDMYSDDESEND